MWESTLKTKHDCVGMVDCSSREDLFILFCYTQDEGLYVIKAARGLRGDSALS